ncbi:MAG: hypothetical protein BWY14_01264 [Parcubacteria group bacterium ADurb.Bin192]|nr:MAG: hypothetical protein BWY14_01264 [Parcubacteria group bacterium ADurb.Bin192]
MTNCESVALANATKLSAMALSKNQPPPSLASWVLYSEEDGSKYFAYSSLAMFTIVI